MMMIAVMSARRQTKGLHPEEKRMGFFVCMSVFVWVWLGMYVCMYVCAGRAANKAADAVRGGMHISIRQRLSHENCCLLCDIFIPGLSDHCLEGVDTLSFNYWAPDSSHRKQPQHYTREKNTKDREQKKKRDKTRDKRQGRIFKIQKKTKNKKQ